MSTGITKPKRHELQSDLMAIAEIPERVKVITSIRLKELLIYIDAEIQSRLRDIDHLLIAQQGSTFEHWAESVSSVFNYNQLIQLKEVIINHLNSEIKKGSTKDQEQPEIISQVFKSGGFEVFNYLDEHFTTFNNRPPTKYTILFHFLEGKKTYPNKTKFIEFVRTYCGKQLNGKKFSKIESDYKTDPNFTDSKPKLTSLYNAYLETSKS